ncbi:MAG: hypothetical protein ACTSSA_12510 [Candidatus Freyarchaeota archaeon]
MILVRIKRLYRGVEYEIEMSFDDLKTLKDLGPIIKMVEEFIDGWMDVVEGFEASEFS